MNYTKESKKVLSVILLFVFIIPISNLVTNIPLVNGETNQTVSNADLLNIPAKKIHVGDIDIGYKMLGIGNPILLFNGASDNMDAWDAAFLKDLTSNHTVIVFDQRGIGYSTVGSKSYTHEQVATDAAGLLDALKIRKADIMGYSLGSYIAQQLTIMYPDKVNSLMLVGSSCGGKDHTPKPPEVIKLQSEVVNKSLNNVPLTQAELKSLAAWSLGSAWVKLHPESLDIPANITTLEQLKPGLPPEIANNQNNVGKHWEDNPNWSGTCDELAKIAKPTLVITGTDDDFYQPHINSLKIVEKIPGAWLVQIKDAGHAVMDQYPDEVGKILQTFLSTISD
jgi:pimeloyl-ACP methyl ester carboxylesterase